jgi:NADH dehydrogenase ubiquinone Fe-S protein 4
MVARIYKPTRNAMQSGTANVKDWVLDFEPESPREVEPLMGWTSSADMKQEIRLRFATRQEAIAYCERNSIPYQVFEPNEQPPRRGLSYADNFAFGRRVPWTH